MLMAMEPIWESDFPGFLSWWPVAYTMIRTQLQLQDGGEQSVAGRWVIEGDSPVTSTRCIIAR